MSFYYKGHRYRLATRLAAEQPEDDAAKEDVEEPTESPCGDPDPADPAVVAAVAVLKGANIEATPVQTCREQDGTDVKMDIGSMWSGIEAVLTFDYSAELGLQEMILKMCGLDFVAHDNNAFKMLLSSIQTLLRASFGPQQATDQVEDKKKSEYIRFLQHYIAEMVQGALDLDYENRTNFAQKIKALGEDENGRYPQDRADVLAEGALRLTDKEWEANILPLVKSSGQQHATTQEMVNRAVMDLIPSGEDYTGTAQVLKYLDGGEILVQLEVPKPAQSFMFVFQHTAGSAALKLKQSGLGLCGGTFSGGPDTALTGLLVSAMVDLAILNGQTAQPELSQPPSLVAKQWNSKEWEKGRAQGMVVWENAMGGVRLTVMDSESGCLSKDQWAQEKKWLEEKPDEVSNLSNALKTVKEAGRDVFLVRPDGTVDLLDYDLNVTKKNVTTIDPATGKACPVK